MSKEVYFNFKTILEYFTYRFKGVITGVLNPKNYFTNDPLPRKRIWWYSIIPFFVGLIGILGYYSLVQIPIINSLPPILGYGLAIPILILSFGFSMILVGNGLWADVIIGSISGKFFAFLLIYYLISLIFGVFILVSAASFAAFATLIGDILSLILEKPNTIGQVLR